MKGFFKQVLVSALGAMFGIGGVLVFAMVIIPLALAVLISGRSSKIEPVKKNSILHLRIAGVIVERRKPMDFEIGRSLFADDRSIGLYEMNKAIDRAKSDKRIAGIYLDIGDFSAGWATLTSLRRSIESFAATGKWVIAYANKLDEMGYYLASSAGQRFMEPYGEVEFNGLAVQEAFVKGLLEKLEIEPQVFRVGRFKAAIEPLTRDKMSLENREQTQTLANDVWSVVRDVTVKDTKMAAATVDELANNLEIVSADSAKSKKLITDLKFADEVEDMLRANTVGEDGELELVTPPRYLRDLNEKHRSGKKIAVIFAEGEIHSGQNTRDSIGSDDFRDDIVEARSDEDVAAIVVRVNSPGGDALASDVIWRELRTTDDDIPVIVSMGDMAASGGYYIASAGRYIFAEPTTITGSIGVFGLMFNTEKFFKHKAGVGFDRVVTHSHSDLGTMSRPVSPQEAKVIQGSVERVYKRFLDVVQESRGFEKRSDLEKIAEGRVWSGTRAKDLGLVDELGGLELAIVKAAEFAEIKDYQIEFFPSEIDPFRHLLAKITGDMFSEYFGFAPATVRKIKSSLLPESGIFARLPFDFKIK